MAGGGFSKLPNGSVVVALTLPSPADGAGRAAGPGPGPRGRTGPARPDPAAQPGPAGGLPPRQRRTAHTRRDHGRPAPPGRPRLARRPATGAASSGTRYGRCCAAAPRLGRARSGAGTRRRAGGRRRAGRLRHASRPGRAAAGRRAGRPRRRPRQTTGLPVSSTPAARSSSSARSVVAAATPAVRSSRTWVRKPSRTASSAVARTQWSVAMPTTSTSVTPRVPQPVGQPDAVLVDALEAAVRRRVRPLVEDRVDRAGGDRRGEVRVEARPPPCRRRSAPARSARSPGGRRSGRPGRRGGRGWPRHGGSRPWACADQVGDGGGDVGAARPPRGCRPRRSRSARRRRSMRGAWRVSFGRGIGRAGERGGRGAVTEGPESSLETAAALRERAPLLPASRRRHVHDVLRGKHRLAAGELGRRQRQPARAPRCAGRGPRPAARGRPPRRR